jgi:hypothetical protein
MTARNEKPSNHESSTDTIIGSLDVVANLLDAQDDFNASLYAQAVRESAQRLDKLETELSKLRGEQ